MTRKLISSGLCVVMYVVLCTVCSTTSGQDVVSAHNPVGKTFEVDRHVRLKVVDFPSDPMNLQSGVIYHYGVELTNLRDEDDVCIRVRLKVSGPSGLKVTPVGPSYSDWQYAWLDRRSFVASTDPLVYDKKDRPKLFSWTLETGQGPAGVRRTWMVGAETQVLWEGIGHPRQETVVAPAAAAANDVFTCTWKNETSRGYLRVIHADGQLEDAEYGVILNDEAVYETMKPVLVQARDSIEFEPAPGVKKTVQIRSGIHLDQNTQFKVDGLNQCLKIYRGRARMNLEPVGPGADKFKEYLIQSKLFRPRPRHRWISTQFGVFTPKETDFVVEVDPASRAVLSVFRGEVTFVLPDSPLSLPKHVAAGRQLIVSPTADAEIAGGVIAQLLNPVDPSELWRVTEKKLDTPLMEEHWQDRLGERPLATWKDLGWFSEDMAYVSEGVTKWLGPPLTDGQGREYYAPLREYEKRTAGHPAVDDILEYATAAGKPAFMVLRDGAWAPHFAFYDPLKERAFPIPLGDQSLAIHSMELIDGGLQVVHGENVDGLAVVTRHEPDFERAAVTLGSFLFEGGRMVAAEVLDDGAWDYIASEAPEAENTYLVLKDRRTGADLDDKWKDGGDKTWWDYIQSFGTDAGDQGEVCFFADGAHHVQLWKGKDLFMTISVDEQGEFGVETSPAARLAPDEAAFFLTLGDLKAETEFNRFRDLPAAIKDYSRAIRLDDGHVQSMAYLRRGKAKLESHDDAEAIEDLDMAIRRMPDALAAYQLRAKARKMTEGYQGAVADSSKALELSPDDAEMCFLRGVCRLKTADYERAVEDFNRIIEELEPTFIPAFYSRGMARMVQSIPTSNMELIKAAEGDFTTVVDSAPSEFVRNRAGREIVARAYYDRALLREVLGNLDGQIEDLVAARKEDASLAGTVDPQLSKAYYSRGVSKKGANLHQEAIADYTAALDIAPEYYAAYLERAYCKANLGDYQGSSDDCSIVLKADARNVGALRLRGFAKLMLGRLDEAIADFTSCIEIDPNQQELAGRLSDAYRLRAVKRATGRDYPGAMEDFAAALEHNPRNAAAYCDRGALFARTGLHHSAIDDFSKAIEIDPQHFVAFSNRAISRLEIGDAEEAIADCDAAIAINVKFATPYYTRARARMNLVADGLAADETLKPAEQDLLEALELGGPDWELREKVDGTLEKLRKYLETDGQGDRRSQGP
ncbi:MAG: tetratricopeptide repeat protein [Pirellulaceae bacterium]